MRVLLKSVAKKLAYVVAGLIIFVAILIGLGRMITPILDEHRGDFEKWASTLLQTPVTIKNVRFSWHGYHPKININGVTVLNQTDRQPILAIERVGISFSVLKSLWQRKLVPSGITISGTEVNLLQDAKGEISVQGFPSLNGTQPFPTETKFESLLTWLSTQPRLTLQNIDVYYTNKAQQKQFVTLYNLNLENDNDEHLIQGKAILHQDVPTEVSLTIKWLGKKIALDQINANVYLYVTGLSLSQWFKEFKWQGFQINQGVVSAKIWGTWVQGSFKKIQTIFQSYGLSLYSETDKSTHKINRLSGNIGWKKDDTGQVLAGDDILIDLPSHLWPVTNFFVSWSQGTDGSLQPKAIHLGYVDIADAQSFLFSFPPFLSPDMQKILSNLKMNGALQNAVIRVGNPWTDLKQLSLNIDFNQINAKAVGKLPGVKNLSGTIQWNKTQGSVLLHSKRLQFSYNTVFLDPIPIDQLLGEVQVEVAESNAWKITIPSLQVLNNDGAANMSGTFLIPAEGSPIADLKANFTMQKAKDIIRYLPMRIFDADLVKWLQQAFSIGEVKSANAVLRGALSDFPFDQGKGQFLISGVVNNVDLKYAPDWPKLSHVNGKLTFSGNSMTVDTEYAETLSIPLPPLHAEIPNFGDKSQILKVDAGKISTDFAQALNFVHASPLEKTLGKMFKDVELHGPITLKLGLTVPLGDPDKTQVEGNIKITDAQMNLVPWHLLINHLSGSLHFTESVTDAKNIKGMIFNNPLTLSLATVQTKNNSVVEASFANHLSISDMENWLKIPFSKVVSGSTDVTGKIDFSLKAPIQVHLSSNLKGLTVRLPDQYAKSANEVRDFSADIILPEREPIKILLNYGNYFSTALILNRKNEKFNLEAADLRLGSGTPDWPKSSGLYISGNFDELDWDKVKGYTNQTNNDQFGDLPLRGINIDAKTLRIAGQRLSQVHLQITPSSAAWNIIIRSPELSGQIRAPANLKSKELITAQFERINLHASANGNQSTSIDVKSLPPISFIAHNVSYNDMPLGQINFKTLPSGSGLIIQNLSIVSPRMNLQAAGQWSQGNQAHLQGSIQSPHVSELLNSLGLDAHNFISNNGNLNFDLGWRGAPYAPNLASLSGHASLNIGPGRIVDIGEASSTKMDIGRMLSIFSLQTIPRRLSLDFSDLFQKGYSFDSVRGDFTFQNGDAFTSNLRFEGPVARVGISGRIGLRNKDYDFTLSVTPHDVTSSLPVAAALITGPVGGVAALAVNTVLGSAVSKVAAHYYAVSGPWDNPTWQSISAPGR